MYYQVFQFSNLVHAADQLTETGLKIVSAIQQKNEWGGAYVEVLVEGLPMLQVAFKTQRYSFS